MNSNLIAKALCFHGQPLQKIWEGERGLNEFLKLGLINPDFSVYTSRQKSLTFQDRAKRLKLHQFIARKAPVLFSEQLAEECNAKVVAGRKDNESLPGALVVMPPYESFLNKNYDKVTHLNHALGGIHPGDIVYGQVISRSSSFCMIRIFCTGEPLIRYLVDVPIKAYLLAQNMVPFFDKKNNVKVISTNDFVCCEVLDVSVDADRMNLGMKGTLTIDAKAPLGIIIADQLPEYYKRSVDNVDTTFGDILVDSKAFLNPNYDELLFQELGLNTDTNFSNMVSLSRTFPRQESAHELRQIQASKWAFRSVADGIEHFKVGRHAEAFQCLNKALSIDPRNVEGLVARGALYANSGSFKNAVEDFQTALKLNDQHANARKYMGETLVALARSYEEENKIEEARKAYVDCLKIIPQHDEAKSSLDFLNSKASKQLIDTNDFMMPGLNMKSVDSKKASKKSSKKKKLKDKSKRRSTSSSTTTTDSEMSTTTGSDSESSTSNSSESSMKKKKRKKSDKTAGGALTMNVRPKSLSPLSKRLALMNEEHPDPQSANAARYHFNKPFHLTNPQVVVNNNPIPPVIVHQQQQQQHHQQQQQQQQQQQMQQHQQHQHQQQMQQQMQIQQHHQQQQMQMQQQMQLQQQLQHQQLQHQQMTAVKTAEMDYDAKVRSFLEMTRDEDDYESSVRKLLENASKHKSERKASEEAASKSLKKKEKKKQKKSKKEAKKEKKKKNKSDILQNMDLKEALKIFKSLPILGGASESSIKAELLKYEKSIDDLKKQKNLLAATAQKSPRFLDHQGIFPPAIPAAPYLHYKIEDRTGKRGEINRGRTPSPPPPPPPTLAHRGRQKTPPIEIKPEIKPFQIRAPVVLDKFGCFRLATPQDDPNYQAAPKRKSRSVSPRRRVSRSRSRSSRPYRGGYRGRSRSMDNNRNRFRATGSRSPRRRFSRTPNRSFNRDRGSHRRSRSRSVRRGRSRSNTPKGMSRRMSRSPHGGSGYQRRSRSPINRRSRSFDRRRGGSGSPGRRSRSDSRSPVWRGRGRGSYRGTRYRGRRGGGYRGRGGYRGGGGVGPRSPYYRYGSRSRSRTMSRSRSPSYSDIDEDTHRKGSIRDKKQNSNDKIPKKSNSEVKVTEPSVEEIDKIVIDAQKNRKEEIVQRDKDLLKKIVPTNLPF